MHDIDNEYWSSEFDKPTYRQVMACRCELDLARSRAGRMIGYS